jgi:hypothetical protein
LVGEVDLAFTPIRMHHNHDYIMKFGFSNRLT